MVWRREDPMCNESRKIVWEVAPYLRGRGLDIGAGDFRVLPHVITVDNLSHSQFGFTQRSDVIADASDLGIFASQSMDFVYSSHTLEHVVDYKAALKEWWRVLKIDGHLVLYLPHKDFYPNIGVEGANPDHKHDFLPVDVVSAMEDMPLGWDLLEKQERNNDMEYSMLLVFKKLSKKERKYSHAAPKPEKTACVVRYGAFGDLMQSSSVWAGLKSQGYHVTVYTSPPGSTVIEHDPHIDNLVLFDKDQVPNTDLVNFWNWHKKKYDKWVNLSESVEGTLLALPGRTVHMFPPRVREQVMNHNYVEFQHRIAGVKHEPNIKFYATLEEKEWARKERKRIGGDMLVLWSLAGSAVHKTWSGLDNVLAAFMLNYPTCRVVLTGGPECQILEGGWEKEGRIVKTSGKWNIRQTLAMLEHADLVIGPETGVLNAASMLPVRKVVMLSHSTVENLTRDWVNATSVWSKNTTCKGRGSNETQACHTLHYGWDHCTRDDESGTARCQADISVDQVWEAIDHALRP